MLNPYIDTYDKSKIRITFNGDCLKRFPPTILNGEIVNIYIVYEITDNFNVSNYPTLENCLFASVKVTKSVDIEKYGYSGYEIGFDRKGFFSYRSWGTGRNVMIFEVDISSSKKIDNRNKYILILGKGSTQRLQHTLSPEKTYSINFKQKNKKFCLSLHYNKENIYLLMVQKFIDLNQKILEFLHSHYA